MAEHNDKFAKMVSMFLAEGLRTRQITGVRAAEIAEKVLANLNLLDTEEQFLRFVKELSKDFEELRRLESRLEAGLRHSDVHGLEEAVRQYAAEKLQTDPGEALEILKAAGQPGLSKASLYVMFPNFKEFNERLPGPRS